MSITATSSTTSTDTSRSATAAQAAGADSMASEQTFLQLFVAQLQNQDPLNPQDSTQFVAELAQFSQLEQSLQMRQDLDGIKTDVDTIIAGSSATGTGATGTDTSGSAATIAS